MMTHEECPSAARAPARPRRGTTVEGFEILREIGAGGMAVVYEAIRESDGLVVALKVLTTATHLILRARFEQEAALGLALRHRNIVRVLEANVSEPPYWIAMERLVGSTLEEALADPSFGFSARIDAVICAARALHHLHERQVIHRDVKPSNVFRTVDGQIKLIDFGVAKLGTRSLTDPGCIPGSAKYVAPEQVSGGSIDRRADVFALGTVAYQLLSGELPWSHGNQYAQMWAKCRCRPKPIADHWTSENWLTPPIELQAALSDVVHRAIRTDRVERFGTVEAFAQALQRVVA